MTLITRRMADALTIVPSGRCQEAVADGRVVEIDLGSVQSLAVQTAVVYHIQVAIGDRAAEGLLGQNFLARFDVRILENQVEFHRR
ncbi:retroviral-like aspartic protease family protein [Microcoleus vaginatus DQ-U2]|uniref:retroviral-like aspartic protease family protein n=1 Tax=Microcoleus vaginatus TaxID=119532 RepID=UPI00168694B3|nr:retroviral-like aspartic protease family protein [Microcoleus sp. FACHB-DQ6]